VIVLIRGWKAAPTGLFFGSLGLPDKRIFFIRTQLPFKSLKMMERSDSTIIQYSFFIIQS